MEEPVFLRKIDSSASSPLYTPERSNDGDCPPHPSPQQHLFVFSAMDPESLKRHISLIAMYAKERPSTIYPQLLRSLAFTLGQRRSTLAWKFAVPALNFDQFVYNLTNTTPLPVKSGEHPKLSFIFTGQGSQWPMMGKSLYYTYPIYALTVRNADQILARLGASWSLINELEKSHDSNIDSAHISQPVCTALQIALVDLLSSWGIDPVSVTGHSSGEIAAAYAAKILDLEACIAIAYFRGVAARTLKEEFLDVSGGMLAVGANQKDTQALIDASSSPHDKAVIACVNSPASMTVSGDNEQISKIERLAGVRSIWNRRLKVDVAYHSHHMGYIADKYKSLLGKIEPNLRTTTEFHSSLKGARVAPSMLTTTYWVENLTSPVLFSQAMKSLCGTGGEDNVDLVVEIGPHSALQGPVRQILQSFESRSRTVQYIPSLVRNEDGVSSMLLLSARLFMSGCRIQLGNLNFPHGDSPDILTDLPPYEWNHGKRYWFESRTSQEMQTYSAQRHDLLGKRVPDCSVLEPQWSSIITADDVPWILDHKVQDLVVFPMAAFICMAIEACRQKASWSMVRLDSIGLREISVHQALVIPDSIPVELRLSLTPFHEGPRSSSDRWSEFKVFSWTSERGWLEHCRGLIEPRSADNKNPIENDLAIRSRLQRCTQDLSREISLCTRPLEANDMYQVAANSGFEYGSMFRQMKEVVSGPLRVAHKVIIPDTPACMPLNYESSYPLHPVTLDAIFHGSTTYLIECGLFLKAPYMPIAIREMTVSLDLPQQPGAVFRVCTRAKPSDTFSRRQTFEIDAEDMQSLSGGGGVSIRGFVAVPVPRSQDSQDVGRVQCLRTQWEPCMDYFLQSQRSQCLTSSSPRPIDDTFYHQRYRRVIDFIDKLAHQNPGLRYLEISAGNTSATVPILEALGGAAGEAARFAHYEFTDISPDTLEAVRTQLAPWGKLVSYERLDIEVPPKDQGYESKTFNVVILVTNPLVDAPFTQRRIAHIRSLLQSGGKLIIIEDANLKKLSIAFDGKSHNSELVNGGFHFPNGDAHGTKGMFRPFLLYLVMLRLNYYPGTIHQQESTKISQARTKAVAEANGFSGLDIISEEYLTHAQQGASATFTTAAPIGTMADRILIELIIVAQWLPDGVSKADVENALNVWALSAVTWIQFTDLSATKFDGKHCLVVDDPECSCLTTMTADSFEGLKTLSEATGILWLTGGLASPEAGMVRGLARTLRSESHVTNFVTLAVDDWGVSSNDILGIVGQVMDHSFYQSFPSTENDLELAVRDGIVCIPRLVHDPFMDQCLARETQQDFKDLQPFVQEGRPLKLTITSPGFLDTLHFVEDERATEQLADDEIEIAVKSAGLNFKDVILALGQLSGDHLGQECSGIVTNVGCNVRTIKEGDRVCAVSGSTIATLTRCRADCAVVIPDSMTYPQGASIPIIYCTAQYCLAHVARLRPNETILIHAAAGGVGQAAIMLAQAVKANVLATVGSSEKKDLLMRNYNIPEECIFYSRDTSFARGVMEVTSGRGVDVALNSLAGEQLSATWQCMASFGRFVEIGKRDITSNTNLEMARFERNVSFAAVDLTVLVQEKPELLQEVFQEVMALFRQQVIAPVRPIHEFAMSEVETAFRSLQTGKLMGKLVVVPRVDDTVTVS